jgi:hypothetical protein
MSRERRVSGMKEWNGAQKQWNIVRYKRRLREKKEIVIFS